MDALRVVAIAAVMLFHWRSAFDLRGSYFFATQALAQRWGNTAFLVLSAVLLEEKASKPGWARRLPLAAARRVGRRPVGVRRAQHRGPCVRVHERRLPGELVLGLSCP